MGSLSGSHDKSRSILFKRSKTAFNASFLISFSEGYNGPSLMKERRKWRSTIPTQLQHSIQEVLLVDHSFIKADSHRNRPPSNDAVGVS